LIVQLSLKFKDKIKNIVKESLLHLEEVYLKLDHSLFQN